MEKYYSVPDMPYHRLDESTLFVYLQSYIKQGDALAKTEPRMIDHLIEQRLVCNNPAWLLAQREIRSTSEPRYVLTSRGDEAYTRLSKTHSKL